VIELPEKLYHYTCSHGRAAIGDVGTLIPGPDGYVWATDLAWPVTKALGLTNHILPCDRTEHRYEITAAEGLAGFLPWMAVRNTLPEEMVFALELAEGAMPRHWFLSASPAAARHSPINRR